MKDKTSCLRYSLITWSTKGIIFWVGFVEVVKVNTYPYGSLFVDRYKIGHLRCIGVVVNESITYSLFIST